MYTLTGTIMIVLMVCYFIPKRLTKAEMFFLTTFSVTFQQTVDTYLDLKFDLYGYFDRGVDLGYMLIIFLLFPPLMIIYTNFFPYGKSIKIKISYIIGWTIVSTIYEHFAVKSSYFYYNGWELVWSAMMYPFLFVINAYAFHLFRKWNKEEI